MNAVSRPIVIPEKTNVDNSRKSEFAHADFVNGRQMLAVINII